MNAEQRAVGTCPRTGDPCACDLLDLDICTTPPTPARDERNLFRLAWAEYMLDDVESVYEQWADDCGYDHRSAIPALGFRRPDKGDPDTLLWCAAFYVFVDQARDGAQP